MSSLEFTNDKIISAESLAVKLTEIRAGKTVVSTNGCFDILHPGHIKFLENAKSLGDILVVALNSDNSVKAIKGESRPIISEQLRAYALSSLTYTDYVAVFQENTPEKLLELIRPDIHVKGEEYNRSGIPEQKVVEANGGKVIYLPTVKGFSTTALIDKIASLSQ